MISVTQEQLDVLVREAKSSKKKRSHLPLHKYSDPVLKLIMAMEPSTYIQPNKHSGENCQELLICLRGRFIVLFFDESGKITEHVLIGPDLKHVMVEVPVGIWHTMWPLSSGSIAMEVIKGPYDEKTYKEFAPWAPSENSPAAKEYKKNTLEKINLF